MIYELFLRRYTCMERVGKGVSSMREGVGVTMYFVLYGMYSSFTGTRQDTEQQDKTPAFPPSTHTPPPPPVTRVHFILKGSI